MADQVKASLFDRVMSMADELKLEGEDKEKYVDQHMQKAGWKRTFSYEPPDGNTGDGKKSDGWF